jgi:Fic family protein
MSHLSLISGGIYHKIQIELTYNSNRIEGSRLTRDQTRYIFETNAVGQTDEAINVDDILETANHFKCVDMIIDGTKRPLSEKFIKELHMTLKNGTSAARNGLFIAGEYKRMPNEVGGRETMPPEDIPAAMRSLIAGYNAVKKKNLSDIIGFHARFEMIHPFQDGNGRVGRLVMFKECLRAGVVPFIIGDDKKIFYYRGLREWEREKGYLTDTCLAAQDQFKKYLDYFRIAY